MGLEYVCQHLGMPFPQPGAMDFYLDLKLWCCEVKKGLLLQIYWGCWVMNVGHLDLPLKQLLGALV